ncbi:hypothetical protein HNP25_000746 [Arcicella rosea]|uniref:Uncharacterized protein n=1 Tax=Arcicella rosea TaxID=502909 RepID=A0A841ED84_9BACT|nr:hypothetical protein [Arcicella rosea]
MISVFSFFWKGLVCIVLIVVGLTVAVFSGQVSKL